MRSLISVTESDSLLESVEVWTAEGLDAPGLGISEVVDVGGLDTEDVVDEGGFDIEDDGGFAIELDDGVEGEDGFGIDDEEGGLDMEEVEVGGLDTDDVLGVGISARVSFVGVISIVRICIVNICK